MVSEFQALKGNARIDLMRRFNSRFPSFYSQFVSSDIQGENLRLAYKMNQLRRAVIEFKEERGKTNLAFAWRNDSYLLSDLFGITTAFNLEIHNVNLYGQVHTPYLAFVHFVLSRQQKPLSRSLCGNVERAIFEALSNNFAVEELLSSEFNLHGRIPDAKAEFYVDPVFHLPAILVEAEHQPAFLYQVMFAIWQEDLTVITMNVISRRKRTRLILYLLGPDKSMLPEYLGNRIAASLQQRLNAEGPL